LPDEEKADDDQQKTKTTPEPVEKPSVSPSTTADHVSGERRNPAENDKHPTDYDFRKWSLRFSAALVLIGAAYSFFAARQWLTMRDQVYEMKQSKYLARLDQRAWVAVWQISGQPELDKPWHVVITAKNSGKTFGKKFFIVARYRIKELADPDPDFAAEEKEERAKRQFGNAGNVISPNEDLSMILNVNDGERMTQDVINYVKSPTIMLLVFGKITYLDIFGCDHWTTFCFRWHAEDGSYEGYGSFNDADENCQE
jgi:hypothetical protein